MNTNYLASSIILGIAFVFLLVIIIFQRPKDIVKDIDDNPYMNPSTKKEPKSWKRKKLKKK